MSMIDQCYGNFLLVIIKIQGIKALKKKKIIVK